jgi:signal transduction histidine kinase
MKRARWWWGLYGACAVAVVVALLGLSSTALDFERRSVVAASHSRHLERLRLALWRMDSQVLPLLSREGARAYFEYLAYYPQDRAYNRFLTELEKGEVLTPSPLLNFAPEYIRLHFQVDRAGNFTSPQVPNGNLRDLAESTCLPGREIRSADACLADVRVRVPLAQVRERVLTVERSEEALSGRLLSGHPLPSAEVRAAQGDPAEWQARQKSAYKSKLAAQNAADSAANRNNDSAAASDSLKPLGPSDRVVHVGTLVPLWLGDTAPELYFFRRVCVGDEEMLQGIWLDWKALESSLLGEVGELLPGARLEPLRSADSNWSASEPSSLATIPVRLVTAETPARADAGGAWRPVHGTLLLTWGVTAVALAAGAFVLRAILALGERRNRFASAVTHELRTPLTTFRMYSEMLADRMVSEPAQRALYLQTLKEESTRLSTLVENVLAYARLEDGRGAARRERVALRDLIERQRLPLERRARDAGLELVVGELPDAAVETDADAVGQVLFNLVDNAAKYARGGTPPRIELSGRVSGRRVVLRVRDFGPGIDPATSRRIFAPFDRGARNNDPTPGVGLGLALARGIAADLDGSLELGASEGPGATFELTLPRAT